MAVWPFRPQMSVVEWLEWVTDIQRCYSAEYRHCSRMDPRMGLQHEYILDPVVYGLAVEVCRANSVGFIDVPEWTSLSDIVPTSAGTGTLAIDASTTPAYVVGGKLLLWESNQSYEVRTISGIGTGTVSIDATTANHGKSTVCPLRSAIFVDYLSADREPVDGYVRCQAGFQISVTEDLTPTYGSGIAYPDYKDSPVVTAQVEIISGAREDISRETTMHDSEAGVLVRWPIYATPNRNGVLAWYCANATEIWNVRRWIHSRKGQQKSFWAPSWNGDVTITKAIAGSDETIEIAACGFASTYTFPMDMGILDGNGGGWFFRVTGAHAGSSGKELLELDVPFDGSVGLDEIYRVSKLTLSRFATDRIEFHHLPGRQATVAVPITEDPDVP